MVGKNSASRKAAKSLGVILTVLLVPVLVFSGILIRKSLKDIEFVRSELAGTAILKLAYPLVFSGTAAIGAKDLAAIAKHEHSLGFAKDEMFANQITQTDDGSISHTFVTGAPESFDHDHEWKLLQYFELVGNRSSLVLDPEPLSYYLAVTLASELPEFSHRLVELEVALSVASGKISITKDDHNGSGDVIVVNQAFGSLRENYEHVEHGFSSAYSHTDDRNKTDAANSALSEIDGQISVMNSTIKRLSKHGSMIGSNDLRAFRTAKESVLQKSEELSTFGLTALEDALQKRKSNLISELLIMLALGLACAAAALYMAIGMFRRNLVKLDVVEESYANAEFARSETERINQEVAQLNRELSDKILKLSAAQDEIVKKGRMEQLGQLTATVAHELRNPLGAVRTSAFLIGKKTEGRNVGIEAQLDRINSGITRCDNIISQLLDYSRTKKIVAQLGDLDDWLAKLVSEEASKIPPNVMIECTLGLDGRHVPYDAARLERAILNMMSNAVEAMTGRQANPPLSPTLWISTFRRGDSVVIRFKDNGPGIAPENLQKIRQPLFTTKNFGTGLGVPAIEQIAEQHGGRLEIESRPGEGACFDLVLPLNAEGTQTAASA
jgi:signal transduction histidine kinase